MNDPGEADRPVKDVGGGKDGVSAFVARVLDQLSLTAWLPAALLVSALAVLFQFQRDDSMDLPRAIAELAQDPFRLLVVLIPLVVIAAMVTQAFSFSAIRMLEGYWPERGPIGLLRGAMTRRQFGHLESLERRRKKAKEKAFNETRPLMLQRGIAPAIVVALESKLYGNGAGQLTASEQAELEDMNWEDMCPPWRRSPIDQLEQELSHYPETSRIMPTSLGNRLRAVEGNLANAGEDLEGFVMRTRSATPPRLQLQHDQFRDRLDMYCTLVFVAVVIAVAAPLILAPTHFGWLAIGTVSMAFLALAVSSYYGAIVSADGYGTALRQMDRIETLRLQKAISPRRF